MLELILVLTLFLTYFALWTIKRLSLIKKDQIDPQVMGKSESNIQGYMNFLMKLLMLYVLALIPLHALRVECFGLFQRFAPLDPMAFDLIGFGLGITGLSICLYAQVKMGASWRVGIDEARKTELVTTGLYSLIRNPTYLGLFLLMAGFWIIWPTLTVFIFCGVFILFLEVQVRCEEDFLEAQFKEEYVSYKGKTKRYVPFIY